MLDVEEFTDQRFKDAVYKMIKECKYPKPAISEIIGFDNSYKVYSYYQALAYCNKLGIGQKDLFEATDLKDEEGKLYWKLKFGKEI